MELASLFRYSYMKKTRNTENIERLLVFFTPCEELGGGNIFACLAADYNTIQPYLAKIDENIFD